MPKSMILARFTSPPGRMTLSGDTSRCTTPSECAACRPAASRWRSARTASNLSGPLCRISESGGPSTNSMARYGRRRSGSIGEDVIAHDRVVREVVEDGGFLAEERERRLVLRHLRADHLDGERVAGLDVVALVDLSHAAGADRRVDLEDAVQPRARPAPAKEIAIRSEGRSSCRIAPDVFAGAPAFGLGPAVRHLATSTVTLSVPPRRSVSATRASQASWGMRPATCCRISPSSTCVGQPVAAYHEHVAGLQHAMLDLQLRRRRARRSPA